MDWTQIGIFLGVTCWLAGVVWSGVSLVRWLLSSGRKEPRMDTKQHEENGTNGKQGGYGS
jgi:hypothetical protein